MGLTPASPYADVSPSLLADTDELLADTSDPQDTDADVDVERWVSTSAMAVVMMAGLSVLLF